MARRSNFSSSVSPKISPSICPIMLESISLRIIARYPSVMASVMDFRLSDPRGADLAACLFAEWLAVAVGRERDPDRRLRRRGAEFGAVEGVEPFEQGLADGRGQGIPHRFAALGAGKLTI